MTVVMTSEVYTAHVPMFLSGTNEYKSVMSDGFNTNVDVIGDTVWIYISKTLLVFVSDFDYDHLSKFGGI